MTAPPERAVRLREDLALNVIEIGDRAGVPVLLVHGLASNARLWDGVAERLAASGHRVAAVDLRGHGRSDKPNDGYDMATVAEDVALAIDALEMERPVVAGQSWGGNVVVELAWAHPERVSGIVCVDGGTIHLSDRFADFDACWAALAPPPFHGATLVGVERYLRDAHPDWPETGISGAMACFEAMADGRVSPWLTRDRHRLVLQGLWEHSPNARFRSIAAPVLFLPAEGPGSDDPSRRNSLDEAVSLLAQAEVRWFSPADHDVHAQHPADVAAAVRSFAERWR